MSLKRGLSEAGTTSSSTSGACLNSCMGFPWKQIPTPKMAFKAESIDRVLADSLSELSIHERDRVYDDIHGTSEEVVETPEFLQSMLDDMAHHIKSCSHKVKEDLLKAELISPKYVRDPSFRLLFLRADVYDAQKAAVRFCKFFTAKLRFFDLGCIGRPIRWTDLNVVEQNLMKRGLFYTYGECRDSIGRPLGFNFIDLRRPEDPGDAIFRMAFYSTMQAYERIPEFSKKGPVLILYAVRSSPADFCLECMREAKYLIPDSLPIRPAALHFCVGSPVLKDSISFMLNAAPEQMKVRTRVHCGSHIEILYTLQSFGIPKNQFPFDVSGQIDQELLNRRLQHVIETDLPPYSFTADNPTIDCPERMDVLSGRGTVIQSFPGNQLFSETLEAAEAEYHWSDSKVSKSIIILRVMKIMEEAGSRFLTRRSVEDPWTIMTENEIRDKVSISFRNLARKYKRSRGE